MNNQTEKLLLAFMTASGYEVDTISDVDRLYTPSDLTLDGEVMVGFRLDDGSGDDGTLFSSKPAVSSGQAKEKIITSNST